MNKLTDQEVSLGCNKIHAIFEEAHKVVVGQNKMLERLMMGLLSDGHILLEGLPGLAKTLAIKTMAQVISCPFNRVQFTPDLLPSDLIGTMIYNQKTNEFTPKKGPIFTSILLADEINRAPAKVQSALLESMAEKQVTIGDETHKLNDPFIVLATQNPIEQEGTYILPEAQMDRFMFKVHVDYPKSDEEKLILERFTSGEKPYEIKKLLSGEEIRELRNLVSRVYLDENIKDYIIAIVFSTREPSKYNLASLKNFIKIGASPRATLFLAKAAKVQAFLRGRSFVTPDDIKNIAYDVLRHRIITTYEAEAEGSSSEDIIKKVFETVPVP